MSQCVKSFVQFFQDLICMKMSSTGRGSYPLYENCPYLQVQINTQHVAQPDYVCTGLEFVSCGTSAFIPALHMADEKIQSPNNVFTVGDILTCRVSVFW